MVVKAKGEPLPVLQDEVTEALLFHQSKLRTVMHKAWSMINPHINVIKPLVSEAAEFRWGR